MITSKMNEYHEYGVSGENTDEKSNVVRLRGANKRFSKEKKDHRMHIIVSEEVSNVISYLRDELDASSESEVVRRAIWALNDVGVENAGEFLEFFSKNDDLVEGGASCVNMYVRVSEKTKSIIDNYKHGGVKISCSATVSLAVSLMYYLVECKLAGSSRKSNINNFGELANSLI